MIHQKTKVLILGSTGMNGHQAYYYLRTNPSFDVYSCSTTNKLDNKTIIFDLRDDLKLVQAVEKIQPGIIVNCSGILTNESEQDPENAIYLNAYLPHRLARLCDVMGCKLIQISTDCVFSGVQGNYEEGDRKDGSGVYALSKSLGEVATGGHLTIRISTVGPEIKKNGVGLFHWFMNQHGAIDGYERTFWSGVSTLQFAKSLEWAIREDITGIYHVTNGNCISKYDLLCLFKKHTGKEVVISKTAGSTIDKSLVDSRREIDYKIPDYDSMVKEMVDSIRSNRPIYPDYELP